MRKFRLLTALAVTAASLFASPSRADAQQRRISGQITATGTNEPLNAASITVVGTALGTYTNEDGRFNLSAPAGPVQLLVRRIGYQRKTVDVGAEQAEVTVQLEKDVLQLERQVITGAATSVAGLNAANDVAVVTADQLNRAPTPTIENALQGKIAGAQINANSGAPGGGIQVRLRGVTSIYGASDPLYVVDGVIVSNTTIQPGLDALSGASGTGNASDQDNGVNRIADLNPADISTIEVLKGASASAIYGAKASNGVIVITTKQGQSGRPQFNVTQRFGTFQLANKLDLRRVSLDTAYEQAGSGTASEILDSATVLANYTRCGGFCDTQEELFGKSGLAYETNLSVRGGNASTKYFASGLVKNDNGIANNTGYGKQALRLNLQQLLGEKLTLQLNTNFVHSTTERGLTNNDNVNATPYFVIPNTPTWYDLRPVNGVYPTNPFGRSNPLQTFDLLKTPDQIYRFIGSVTGSYNLMTTERQSLTVQAQAGLDQFSESVNLFSPRDIQWESVDGLPGTATALSGLNINTNYSLSVAHKYFPASRAFTATTSLGFQREQARQRTSNIVARDLIPGQEGVNAGAATSVFAHRDEVRDLAMYAQEEFLTLDERMLLTLGARAQRSTANGDIDKFYVFPKSSISYRMPAFTDRLDELKLRLAVGQSGNEPLAFMKYTTLPSANFQGLGGVNIGLIDGNGLAVQGDPNIKPEIQTEIETGIDATGFNQRANVALTFYQKTINDLILRPTPAPSTGFNQMYLNGGVLRNRGVELAAALTPVQTDALTWVSRATFARNYGKITELPPESPRSFTISGSFGYGRYTITEGDSPTAITGPDTLGNTIKYGDTAPTYTMGFANELTYGPFRAYALLDRQKGGRIINITENVIDEAHNAVDRAAEEERLYITDDLGAPYPYVQDGSFWKLREVTLSYEFPQGMVDRFFGNRARGVRAELSGRNLATWTPYRGLDPEVSNFGNTNIRRNADLAPFPPTRSYFFSISADF